VFVHNCGLPQGSTNLFFTDIDYVKDQLFTDYVDSITRPIEAPVSANSDGLIMNQIRHVFMKQDINGKWLLKRAKSAPRFVHFDLSETGDSTGAAMVHPEMSIEGQIIFVADFIFDILPGKEGINLDAVKEFARSLYKNYHIHVAGFSTDRHQSPYFKQAMEKDDRNYKLISMDIEKTPYIVLKSKILTGAVKTGYYLNLFNNLRCLVENKDKIDHPKTRKTSDGDKALGINSKDLTDALCGAVFNAIQEQSKYQISYIYEDINQQIELRKKFESGETKVNQGEKSILFNQLLLNINRNSIKA
jgi:hypothetical protein